MAASRFNPGYVVGSGRPTVGFSQSPLPPGASTGTVAGRATASVKGGTFSISGSGFAIDSTTGVITTTGAVTAQTYTRTVTSTTTVNGVTVTLAKSVGIVCAVVNVLSISGTPVTTATQNAAYAGFSVTGSGGTAPYTYSVASGSLPVGLSLNSSTGAVSGTPTIAGASSSIVLRVTDALGATADLASFVITTAAGGAFSFSLATVSTATPATVYTDTTGPVTGGPLAVAVPPGMSWKTPSMLQPTGEPGMAANGEAITFYSRSSDAPGTATPYTPTVGSATATKTLTTAATTPSTLLTDAFAVDGVLSTNPLWVNQNGAADNDPVVISGRVRNNGAGYVRRNTTSVPANCHVRVEVDCQSVLASDSAGIIVRGQSAAYRYYQLTYNSAGSYTISRRNTSLNTMTGGSITQAASGLPALAAGQTRVLEAIVTGDTGTANNGVNGSGTVVNGVAVAFYADGVYIGGSWEVTANVPGTGSAGIIQSGAVQTDTTGLHLKNFSVKNVVGVQKPFTLPTLTGLTPGATTMHTLTTPITCESANSDLIGPQLVTITGGRYKIGAGTFQTGATWMFPGEQITAIEFVNPTAGNSLPVMLMLNGVGATLVATSTGTKATAVYRAGGTRMEDQTGGTKSATAAGSEFLLTKTKIPMPQEPWENPVFDFIYWYINGTGGANAGTVGEVDGSGSWKIHRFVLRNTVTGICYEGTIGGKGNMPYSATTGGHFWSDPLPISGTGGEVYEFIGMDEASGSSGRWCLSINGAGEGQLRGSTLQGMERIIDGTTVFQHFSSGHGFAPSGMYVQGPAKSVQIFGDSKYYGAEDSTVDARYNFGCIRRALDGTMRGSTSIPYKMSASPGSFGKMMNAPNMVKRVGRLTNLRNALNGGAAWTFTHITTNMVTNDQSVGGGGQAGVTTMLSYLRTAFPGIPIIGAGMPIRTEKINSGGTFTLANQRYEGIGSANYWNWVAPNADAKTLHEWMQTADYDHFINEKPYYDAIGIDPSLVVAVPSGAPIIGIVNPDLTDADIGDIGESWLGLHALTKREQLLAKWPMTQAKLDGWFS